METIRMYMDNMFYRFPQSPQLLALKEDMLRSMEDRYEELRSQGMSENEAIGSILSEFGNIDELAQELGFSQENPADCRSGGRNAENGSFQWTDALNQETPGRQSSATPLSPAEVRQYLYETARYSRLSALGATLLLPGSAALALLLSLLLPSGVKDMSIAYLLSRLLAGEEVLAGFSLPSFLLLAVPLLIWVSLSLILLLYGNGMRSQCSFPESAPILLDSVTEKEVQTLLHTGRTGKRIRQAAALILTCLSPCFLLHALSIAENSSAAPASFSRICTGLILLFLLLAPSLYLFLTAGDREKACLSLLRSCRLTERTKSVPRFLTSSLSFLRSWYWVLISVLYFLISFRYHNWKTSWLIWLIAPIGDSLLESLQNAVETQKKDA